MACSIVPVRVRAERSKSNHMRLVQMPNGELLKNGPKKNRVTSARLNRVSVPISRGLI